MCIELELKDMATKIANTVVERSYNEYGSCDIERPSTKEERQIIFKIAFGALWAFNWGKNNQNLGDGTRAQGILDCAEGTFIQFFNWRVDSNEPHLNSYMSIYLPLKKIFEEW